MFFLLAGCSTPTLLHVRVIDTDGKPVANAKVNVGWTWYPFGSGWDWNASSRGDHKEGISNEKGEYNFFGLTRGEIGVSASKEGFYSGGAKNPQQIILRRKIHPVPMYAKQATYDLPSGEGDYGYDMFAGDLVAPYGVGVHVDFIIRVGTTNLIWRGRQFKHLQADIVFPNPADGIQAVFIPSFVVNPSSAYRFPFMAPEFGYKRSMNEANGNTQLLYNEYQHQPQIKKDDGKSPARWLRDDSKLPKRWYWVDDYQLTLGRDRVWSEEINYFIKIRSDTIGHACYGIIPGYFRANYRGNDIPSIEFSYYVNPDGTRNIEIDGK